MTNNSWRGGEGLKVGGNKKKLSTVSAIVMDSKIYLIHGYKIGEERNPNWVDKPYVAQNIMCGKNSRQPAILILNPVFLLSITDCVAWGEGVRRGPAPVGGLNEGTKTL